MGLKNRLSKMKNFLFDEEEVKEEKKEVKKVKKPKQEVIEEPTFDKEDTIKTTILEDDGYSYNFDNDFDDIVKKEEYNRDTRTRATKQEFTIPELTDDDFMFTSRNEEIKPEPIIEQPLLYQGSKKRKEEVRRFKPSPNISPVYGLLDENGNHITDDKQAIDLALNNKDEVSLDDVRKKAYGKLDSELDNTLKRLNSKTIEEAEEDNKKQEEKKEKKKVVKETKEEVKEPEEDEDEDMILPSVSFKEINVDEEAKDEKEEKDTDDDDDEETKEQDLFNLIDNMYSKDGEE